MKKDIQPPRWADKVLSWFCSEKVFETLQGDLYELYCKRLSGKGKMIADFCYARDVFDVCRPFAFRSMKLPHLNLYAMFKSYFKISWRNLLHNRGYSFINVGGLAIGLTVVIFLALWIFDELSFNKYHKNYDHIAQVWSGDVDPITKNIRGGESIQLPVRTALKNNYPQYFNKVLVAWWVGDYSLATPGKKLTNKGQFIESGVLDMLSLKMLTGSYQSLDDLNSIVISKSTAQSIFGTDDPMNKTITIDGRMEAKVTGIFEDIPRNNRYGEVQFFAPWSLWLSVNSWAQDKETDWDNRPFNILVQLQPKVSLDEVNKVIKDLYRKNVPADFYSTMEKYKPFVQLIPMNKWHLFAEFKDGKPSGGRITYVWLFGIVGFFVLLLACINFINLSTARSEKRAKEVGVRKAMGSGKWQLVAQFITESILIVAIAFILSLGLIALLQPWFNELADKEILLPFRYPLFWAAALLLIVITGFVAGTYPAFYLSAFKPVQVLKGVFRSGRFAALPRQVLVVVQFTASLVLITGTIIVYDQIQHARNRPVGYVKENLLTVELNDPNYKDKLDLLKTELLRSTVVAEIATSSGPITSIQNVTSGYEWPDKDPNLDAEFAICNVTTNFGKTVNWEFVSGRDFSEKLKTDSGESIIINEAARKYMGLKDPIGKELTDVNEFGTKKWSKKIIGVVKDMVMESPYQPVKPTLFYFNSQANRVMHIKLNSTKSPGFALGKIESVFTELVPSAVFNYKFVDEEYAHKFSQEERIGKLSGVFSILAICISCLGLFGLASFVAEQRTREIGIRKVVGASVFSLWKMLTKDFVVLVVISSFIAIPISYYFLSEWLVNFEYRTDISWWVFLVTVFGSLVITLLTVSLQAIKAALMNPVKSLRSA